MLALCIGFAVSWRAPMANVRMAAGSEQPIPDQWYLDKIKLDAKLVDKAKTALDENPLADVAAATVIRACAGLDRGLAASQNDAKMMLRAIEDLETAAPCTLEGEALSGYLSGTWKLLYSSQLVGDQAAARGVALLGVSQNVRTSSKGKLIVEESISTRAQVPWPLPPAPAVEIICRTQLDAATLQATSINFGLQKVDVRVPSIARAEATIPFAQLRDWLDSALPAREMMQTLVDAVAPLKALRTKESGATNLRLTAASDSVRVIRSGNGEIRVFARGGGGGIAAATKASSAAAKAGTSPLLDAEALKEVARVRKETEASAARVLAAAAEEAEADRAQMEALLDLAAAAEAAVSEEKEDVLRQLSALEQRAAEAAAAAESTLTQAMELAEAKAAAAQAVAAAELAEAVAKADEELNAAQATATQEQQELSRQHSKVLQKAEASAAEAIAAAAQELAMLRAAAEAEAAAARTAFAEEKRVLMAELDETKKMANKAKAAAIAALGEL